MNNTLLGRDQDYFNKLGAGNTAREIAQQPKMWRDLARVLKEKRESIAQFMEKVDAIKGLRVIFTGAGSSAFIGESMQMLLVREFGIAGEAIHTTDIVTSPDSTLLDVPTLIVSYSRSGESPESIGALEYATKKITQLYNLIIVCKDDSSVANYAEGTSDTLVLKMPPESCDLGFAMTSSISCMSLATWCAFGYREIDKRLDYIQSIAKYVEAQMDTMDEQARIAGKWGYDRAVFLGCGALRGLAREAAVKMLELTSGKVNAGWDSSAGFRHGPKSVINSSTLTVHLLSPLEHTRRYDEDLLEEVLGERKGNRVIAVGPEVHADADMTVSYARLNRYEEISAYLIGLVFIQLLALETSLEHGITSDNPCVGGEVNRVVQGVKIYNL